MKIKDKVRAKAPVVVEPPTGVEATQSDAPKKKIKFNRRTLFKIMFVVSIIFIMISLTYAWFSLSETGFVNGFDVGVTDPNVLTPGGLKFEGIVDSITGDGTSFFKPIMEKQLVGTQGDYNLYKNVNSGKYYDLEDDVESETAVVKNLYIQDFTLSINGKHNIYMVEGTGIKSTDENSNVNLEAAMRVGIMKFNSETQKYELALIWIPDVGSGSNLDNELTVVVPDGEGGTKEKKIAINSEHGQTTHNGVKYVWGKIDGNTENNVLIGELSGIAKYRCVLWVDGNDRDCNKELLDQEFLTVFKFNPEVVVESETENDTDETK